MGQAPDVIGYPYEEAQRILLEAEYRIEVCPTDLQSDKKIRVLRQRRIAEKITELILGYEMYDDPSLEEKEVKKDGVQDRRRQM